MNFLIDLIVVAIIGLCILTSAKRGFVKVLIEVIGFVLAIIITFTISTPLAQATYDKIIEPPLLETVNDAVESTGDSVQNDAWNALPDFVTDNAEKIGLSLSDFVDKITDNLSGGTTNAVKIASQDVVKPIVSRILELLYSIIIMIVLLFVVKLIAKVLNKVFSFSIIGKANTVLGGIIGIPKGIVFAIVFCMVISLIVSLGGEFLIFTHENIEKTMLFKLFADIITF